MFEIGIQLKKERGAANVFDYSIGNPEVEPPREVVEALRQVVAENRKGSHGYMPNAGYPEVRERIAGVLMLYPICRWYAGVKRRRTDWWLGYL